MVSRWPAVGRHPGESRLRGLYALTDARERRLPDLLGRAEAVLAAGATVLQYRDKSEDRHRRLREAEALRRCCADAGARFIVNDDVALAVAVAADGVHLGEDDGPVQAARTQLGPGAWIGVSCYNDLQRARQLLEAGCDYLAFGAAYPSVTKPGARRLPLPVLAEARQEFTVPLVVIGGIDADNLAPLVRLGADAVAVASAVFSADDPGEAARRVIAAFASAASG